MFKKGRELSILCGVEVVMIVQDHEEGHSTLWPSPDKVMDGVMKFTSIPERERLKKMVLQEKFLMNKLQDMSEKLLKLQKMNEEREMGFLMNQFINGTSIDELDTRQLNGMYRFADENLKKLQSGIDGPEMGQGQLLKRDTSHRCHPSFQMPMAKIARGCQENGATSNAARMEDMKEDRWFGDNTVSGIQNNFGFYKGEDVLPESNEVVRSFNEGNQGEIRDGFGNVWPTFFSP